MEASPPEARANRRESDGGTVDLRSANKKQKAIMLIVLDNLQRKAWCVGVENVAQFSTSFIHGGRRKAGVELTRNNRLYLLYLPLCLSGPRHDRRRIARQGKKLKSRIARGTSGSDAEFNRNRPTIIGTQRICTVLVCFWDRWPQRHFSLAVMPTQARVSTATWRECPAKYRFAKIRACRN
jgi:hypothetical protein